MTVQELKAKYTEAHEAMVELADKEELTAEEAEQFDQHKADCDQYEAALTRHDTVQTVSDNLKKPRPVLAAAPPNPDQAITHSDPGTGTIDVTMPGDGPRVVAVPSRGGRPINGFGQGQQAERDAYFMGQWAAATLLGDMNARAWCRDHGQPIAWQSQADFEHNRPGQVISPEAVMNLSDNSAGGYVVPDALSNAIIVLREERGVFRREARVWPMNGGQQMVPRLAGDATVYAVGEKLTSTVTASDLTLDQIELVARTWAALVLMTQNLADDSIINLGELVAGSIGYGMADKEDEAGFNGDGTSTYHGITGVLNATAAGSDYTAATGNIAFSSLDLADFEGTVGTLKTTAVANAKWYMSRVAFYQSVQRLADAGGGNTVDTLAAGTGAPRSQSFQWLGFPVVISEVLNSTVADQVSTAIMAFGDLRQSATLGDRKGFAVRTLNERYAELLQIGILGWSRWDIVVHEVGDASTAGSIITVKTPGS